MLLSVPAPLPLLKLHHNNITSSILYSFAVTTVLSIHFCEQPLKQLKQVRSQLIRDDFVCHARTRCKSSKCWLILNKKVNTRLISMAPFFQHTYFSHLVRTVALLGHAEV